MPVSPNVMPIKNDVKGRKPVVDKILGETYRRPWLKEHPTQEKKYRAQIDRIVCLAIRHLNQIAAQGQKR